jgi:translation initiation factor 2 alpha subunit (eIF-2alpha)
MSNLTIDFYNTKPQQNENVVVVFTDHKTTHVEGKLLEYPFELFMTYSDASKKRRVTSWNTIVPLNKPIVARVDDANYGSNIIQVSLCYLYEDKTNNDIDTKRKILYEPFIKNNVLVSIFKKLSLQFDKDINDLWKSIMYNIDDMRRSEYDLDDMPQLLDYCLQEKDTIKNIFYENGYDEIYSDFEKLIDKTIEEKPCKLVSNIEIISNGGVDNTVKLIKKCIKKIKFDNTFKYQTAPVYLFESNSIESNSTDHSDFIKDLEKEGQLFTPKIFVRCQEIAKAIK